MIYCTCNVSVLEPLLKALDEIEIDNYQVIEQLTAKNMKGSHRFNTPVWPGYNSAVIIQSASEEKSIQIMDRIRSFNQKAFNDNELVIACRWTLDDLIVE